MSGVGGKLCYFVGAGTGCGLGFQARKVKKDDIKLSFQGLKEYVDLGTKCALAYVSVDGFIFSNVSQECDIASLVELSRISSGYLNYWSFYDQEKDNLLF